MTPKQFISSLFLSLILMGCLSKKTSHEVNQRLNDIWVAKRINGNSINESDYRPTLEINLKENKIYGSDGCNNYQGNITKASEITITFGPLASTRKMCQDMTNASAYNNAMKKVESYKIEGLELTLFNAEDQELLVFYKGD